jgi:predicted metal-dependent HD superfamily phosphohydrolase
MGTFCLMLEPCSVQDQRKIEIAASFHDIGIWTDNTLDYLPPSVPPAHKYLDENGLADWAQEISEMILQHHKLRKIKDGSTPMVELFRKGDLVDFSKGMVRFGLPRKAV